MEQHAGHIVVMASASVDFPSFRIVHSPQFNLSVVGSRDYKGQSWMETRPVDAAIMTFENVFDNGVGLTEKIGRAGVFQVLF